MTTESRKRPYRKRARAEQEAETRRRITEAAVKLHGSIGPARTTVKGLADEAGVQRATVYRHFPTEEELFAECSAHWASLNPPPDPTAWAAIADTDERLRTALAQLYEWYEWAEPMLATTQRDAPLVPAMATAMAQTEQFFAAMRTILLRGRHERGRSRRRASAAIALALAFPTWRTLAREQGLERPEVVAAMAAAVKAAGAARPHGAG